MSDDIFTELEPDNLAWLKAYAERCGSIGEALNRVIEGYRMYSPVARYVVYADGSEDDGSDE